MYKKFFFASVFLLPSFIFVAFNNSSYAFGLIILSIASFFFINNGFFKKNFFNFILFIIFFVFIYSIFGFYETNNLKILGSLFFMLNVFLIYFFYDFFCKSSYKSVYYLFLYFCFFLIVLGWVSFLNLNFYPYDSKEKPVFPFLEQSHYALIVGLFAVALSTVISAYWFFLIFTNVFLLSVFFPSLTLLVFSFLALFVFVLRRSYILIVFSLIVFFLVSYFFVTNNSYFLDRFFLFESDNLTALVWIQGLELAFYNFFHTNAMGLGFNALGLSTTYIPEVSNKINIIYGGFFNIYDGGFLASKIISEFGILGLFFIVYFFYFLIFNFGFLYGYSTYGLDSDMLLKKRLLYGLVFGFSVEMFLRGIGYFSPTFILMLAVIVYFKNTRYLN